MGSALEASPLTLSEWSLLLKVKVQTEQGLGIEVEMMVCPEVIFLKPVQQWLLVKTIKALSVT